jgi:hypothetical protein
MGVQTEIITIGFDKNGEAEFGVSALVGEVGFEKMNELRAMIPVAIGVAEDMWKRTSQLHKTSRKER